MAIAAGCYRAHRLVLRDGRAVTVRAVTEADAPAIQRAFDRLSPESRYSRFLQHKKHLDPAALARGVHPQPGQGFVLVATVRAPGGTDIVGAAQYVRANPTDDSTCEFAITVAEDWRGCGLARALLADLLHRARCDHYEAMVGLVMADNAAMLALAQHLGFRVVPSAEGDTVVQVLRQLEPCRDDATDPASHQRHGEPSPDAGLAPLPAPTPASVALSPPPAAGAAPSRGGPGRSRGSAPGRRKRTAAPDRRAADAEP